VSGELMVPESLTPLVNALIVLASVDPAAPWCPKVGFPSIMPGWSSRRASEDDRKRNGRGGLQGCPPRMDV